MQRKLGGRGRPEECGAALLLVTVILVVVLIGGLAAVTVTSSDLTSSRGFRSRQAAEACAIAGLEKARATFPSTSADGTLGAMSYRTGHYGSSSTQETVTELDASTYDASSLYEGENATNSLGASGGAGGVRVLSVTSVCSGTGAGAREMEMIFRYGNPLGDR